MARASLAASKIKVSLAGSHYDRSVPILDTPRALYEHDHKIAAHCSRCERWQTLGLFDFVKMGKAEQHIAQLSLRCGTCGKKGSIQIRSPMPQIEQYGSSETM